MYNIIVYLEANHKLSNRKMRGKKLKRNKLLTLQMERIEQNYNRKLFWQFEKFQTNLKANFGTQTKQSSFTIHFSFSSFFHLKHSESTENCAFVIDSQKRMFCCKSITHKNANGNVHSMFFKESKKLSFAAHAKRFNSNAQNLYKFQLEYSLQTTLILFPKFPFIHFGSNAQTC